MERNDIIKALECCSKYYGVSTCAQCPKWAEREFYKPCDITSESLALIKEVLEENESLKKSLACCNSWGRKESDTTEQLN